jgi:hypothetical protein
VALIGIVEMQWGHSFVVGSPGASSFCIRLASRMIKKIANAMIRKLITVLIKTP